MIGVLADERGEVEDRVCADDAGVSGGDVEGLDLRTLVGVADVGEDRIGSVASADDVLNVQIVVGVRGLEPGTAVVEVQVHGVDAGEVVVDAVEEVLFVALVMEDDELGRIEEAAGVEAVELEEVAPVLSAVAQVNGSAGGAEGPVGAGDGAGGGGDALSGAGGDVDDEAGLVAVLGRRRAGDDLDGLHGVRGKLVGEDFALLIGDGLPVDREGVRGVITESVKEAVRVGGNARRGQGDERAQRRGLAFEGNLQEGSSVEIGVQAGVILDEVAAGDGYGGGGGSDLEREFEVEGHEGADFNVLDQGGEAVFLDR